MLGFMQTDPVLAAPLGLVKGLVGLRQYVFWDWRFSRAVCYAYSDGQPDFLPRKSKFLGAQYFS
jgi:hypothetical protein